MNILQDKEKSSDLLALAYEPVQRGSMITKTLTLSMYIRQVSIVLRKTKRKSQQSFKNINNMKLFKLNMHINYILSPHETNMELGLPN